MSEQSVKSIQRRALPLRKRDCRNGNSGWFKSGESRNKTHGESGTKTHKIWLGMLSRCNTKSATSYENYGGRGIRVCDRWMKYENFISDMGECPQGMSIDRINTDGDYKPDNCRWATKLEQNRNQRDLVYLEHDGKKQCVSAWEEELGFPTGSIRARLRRGWDAYKSLTTPIRAHKPYERNI